MMQPRRLDLLYVMNHIRCDFCFVLLKLISQVGLRIHIFMDETILVSSQIRATLTIKAAQV